jgi:hypothetical protein
VDEIHSTTEVKKQTIFDGLIERRWGTSINLLKQKNAKDLNNNQVEEYENNDKPKRTVPNIEDTVNANGKLLNHQQLVYNKILHSEVSLQLGVSMTVGRVTKGAIGPNRTVAGTYNENTCLNTMIY